MIDARKEEFERIELLGKPTLLCEGRVDRRTVPKNLYCYDLRGSDNDPGRPVTAEPRVIINYVGTVIMTEPLKMPNGNSSYVNIKNRLSYCGEGMTLKAFVAEQGLAYLPQPKYDVCAAKENEAAFFYSGKPEDDARRGCIGHLRFDIEKGGKFWSTFWDHNADLKTNAFREDLQEVVDELREGPLASLSELSRFCHAHADDYLPKYAKERHSFFRVDSESHSYFMRLYPHAGDYSYIYCYDKDMLRQYTKAQGQSPPENPDIGMMLG